jgi:hypothetical protein
MNDSIFNSYFIEVIIGLMAMCVVFYRVIVIGFPMLLQGIYTQEYGLIFKSVTQFV